MSSEARPQATLSDRLLQLVPLLADQPGFAAVVDSLTAGHGATIGGTWGSSCALAVAALAQAASGPLVVVLAHGDDIEAFLGDLALFSELPVDTFPPHESGPRERVLDDEYLGQRLRLLKQLLEGHAPQIVVTSIQAIQQPVPRRAAVREKTRRLEQGAEIDVPALITWLVENGFHSTSAVELPGELSHRGGILDLFAPDWNEPVRLEFFGDQIESIRRFEVASQRSLDTLSAIDVTALPPSGEDREHFAGFLPEKSWFALVEPSDIEEEGRHFLERLENPADAHSVPTTLKEIYRFPSVTLSGVPVGSLETTCHLKIESVERFSGDIAKVRDELDAASTGQEVYLVSPTAAEIERLEQIFGPTRLAEAGRLHFCLGHLRAGFRLVPQRIALVSGGELFHRTDLHRSARRKLGRVIDSFLELREGDYVVHLSHGIGRYRGLKLLEKEGQVEEHLILEFQEQTKIYVPASKIELVQKYVGGAKSKPTLAKIGGRSWVRQKQAAEEAVTDLAADMLQLQAARATRPGISFASDTPWQQEFDAAFPYRETRDQMTAISSIKRDMLQSRPMDRLLCGDVGFGKTEVAMRAAFKAVDSGYQVAVLVPTTILAEQHLRTFRDRMAAFPFTIASLSRFSTPPQQKKVLTAITTGGVDIVIGTHRLAQHDVQFANLGLLVIDEEQRFGVEVKERLKALRQTIDVLTMTATPIPRTLHLSLLGVRDISNLESPPDDRLAVETRVTRFEPELIRHAVLRELNRGGQIFFVHNRVNDIEKVAGHLNQIVPEARVAIGHGQMPEHELEKVMVDFVHHRFDLLLATTIVESGLDIPNANTIFIDEADRYGLADLHQLRGRVGRYKHRAYCYLLVEPHKHLSPQATRRLRAIEEFSDMGAGFAIAMRDLELRGAGNILGTQQSGHIAVVGYELYCELLEQAIRRLKKMAPKESVDVELDLPGEAYLPRTYVPDMRLKIDLYRRLARVADHQHLEEIAAELVDRFGPRPAEVDHMLALTELRLLAHHWHVRSIHLEPGFAVLRYVDRRRIMKLAEQSRGRLRVVDDRSAYLPLAAEVRQPAELVAALKALLRHG
ncbi:MAG TPA: transcription-repair coupling factor [Pirellulales bacterium]|nr:transcription-repair coupling factor [Pirellulales bacterium]